MSRARSSLCRLLLTVALAAWCGVAVGTAWAEEPPRGPAAIPINNPVAEAERVRLLAMVHEKREEEIALLRSLLARASGERRSGLLLRLGTLFEEQGAVELARAMEAMTECEATCDCVCDPDRALADTWFDKALRAYERVGVYDPRYEDADTALLYRGALLADLGRPDEAVAALEQLVSQYPTSDVAATAWLRLGRLLFDVNEIKPATLAFERARAETSSPLHGYAVYMHAWSLYNLGEYNAALDAMREVVERSFEVPKGLSAQDTDDVRRRSLLQDESLKDLALFYTESNDYNEGEDFLVLIGQRELVRTFREHLVRVFQARGWWPQEAAQYAKMLRDEPLVPEAVQWQIGRVRAQLDRESFDNFLAELAVLRETYRPGTPWWDANVPAHRTAAEIDNEIESTLRAGATRLNTHGRDLRRLEKRDAPRVLGVAAQIYDLYFASYGGHELAYDARFDYADLLWILGRKEEAYAQWEAALQQRPDGLRTADAARDMMLAARDLHKAAKVPPVPAGKQPVPLHPAEQRLFDAYLRFADTSTDDRQRREATYQAAVLRYEHREYDVAQPLLRRVTALWPQSKEAEEAAHRVLFALEQQGRIDDVRAYARELRSSSVGASSSFINDVADIEAAASFTRIEEQLAATGDKAAAATALVQLFKDYPGFNKRDLALNNAAVYFRSLERWEEAAEASRLLIDAGLGPKSPYYMTQLSALAYYMERTAAFDQAIDLYGRLWRDYPAARAQLLAAKPPDEQALAQLDAMVADAVWTSAIFNAGFGKVAAAVTSYESFIDAFPEDPRALDVELRIGDLLLKDGDHRGAIERYAAFAKAHPASELPELHYFARLQEGLALRAIGEGAKAMKTFESTVTAWKRARKPEEEVPDDVAVAIGEMLFYLHGPKLEALSKIRFTSVVNGEGLKGPALQAAIRREDQAAVTALRAKTAAFVAVKDAFTEIVTLRAGDWVLRSLVAIGEAAEDMKRTFESAQCSFYLTPDQCDIYRMRMQDRAYPLGQTALEYFTLAVDTAREAQAWSPAVKTALKAYDRLAEVPLTPTELLPGYTTATRAHVYELEATLDPPVRARPEVRLDDETDATAEPSPQVAPDDRATPAPADPNPPAPSEPEPSEPEPSEPVPSEPAPSEPVPTP
jgi:tetratricopeptide (TPR) repeat protein